MLNRTAGIHRIDSELISTLQKNEPVSDHMRKVTSAHIWQLNAFVQAGKSLWPDGSDMVMHASRTKHVNADGKKVSCIALSMRPKGQGILSFLDDLFHEEERKLAANVLHALMRRTGAGGGAESNASVPRYQASPSHPGAQPATYRVNDLAPDLKRMADNITAELLDAPENKEPLFRQDKLRNAVRAQQDFREWVAAGAALDGQSQIDLQRAGFRTEGIATFGKLASSIARGTDPGRVAMDALLEFRMQWVATCGRTDAFGASFRQAVCSNPTFRAWNVLAHHLAGQTQPRFDLSAHEGYCRVMVPDADDMIWAEAARDNGAAHAMARGLHARARQTGKLEFEPSADGKHQLFAAYKKFRDSAPNQLSATDQAYLYATYGKFIHASIDAGESFLLAPLFDYEEGTIAACMETLLAPIKTALAQGKRLPQFALFSTDPRIDQAFRTALARLETEVRDVQGPRPERFAAPTGMAVSPAARTEKLRLQIGIRREQWEPDEKTLFLLTGSSRDCAPTDDATVAIELTQALASPEFSAARNDGVIFRETKQKSPWGCDNRYVAAQEEVLVQKSGWLIGSAALDDRNASEIQMAYARTCKFAVTAGIRKLVLTPCFREAGGTLLSASAAYEGAVGVMMETLAESSRLYPQLELTIVARSRAERKLMEKAMEGWRQALRHSAFG